MQFPEKYLKRGSFTLHSGQLSDRLYDINALLTDGEYFSLVISSVPGGFDSYVGIATGGAIIASHLPNYAMVKDKELKGVVKGRYCLIDDVCTTEGSIREAINVIGRTPDGIFVVVDRRSVKHLKINSLYQSE